MSKLTDHMLKWIGAILSVFVVITLNFVPLGPDIFRPLMVLMSAVLIFGFARSKYKWLDALFMVLSVCTFGYALKELEGILERGGIYTTHWDLIFGTLGILLVLEMTRRTVGLALPIISVVFFLYALFGSYLPGDLGHKGYSYKRIVTSLFTYDGIFGMPVAVAITFVAMFIIFASILELTGAGSIFLDLSKGVAGHLRGGPAKVATIASCFFGSISGSAVANVAATGAFTIPIMKKMGYKGTFAAAVEAAASTGGQFTPPIMAAGAFLMAEIVGIPYTDIILAAIIPALLYYVTIWFTIDFRSAKIGLKGLSREEIPSAKQILVKQGYMLLPLVVLILELTVFKVSAIRAALIAMIASFLLSFIRKETRPNLKSLFHTLFDAAKGIAQIVAPVACAGMVIGIVGLTGLGGKIASFVIGFSGGNVYLSLVLAMVTAIIFGMGLPTTVSYLLVVSVLAPVLSELGIQPLAAHLFIFYFACLSGITPPVALAAYTGANLAGASPIKTAFEASKLAIAAYILPFLFVFEPSLLMDGSWGSILLATITASLGVISLAAGLEGWLLTRMAVVERILLVCASLVLIKPGLITDMIGFVLFIGVLFYQKYKKNASNSLSMPLGQQDSLEKLAE